jgi:hypothetical protein
VIRILNLVNAQIFINTPGRQQREFPWVNSAERVPPRVNKNNELRDRDELNYILKIEVSYQNFYII